MISVTTFSEVGGHRRNEDVYAVQPHASHPNRLLICLADGQGGQAGGGEAAQLACDSAMSKLRATPHERLSDIRLWSTHLGDADAAVTYDAGSGFTTLIAVYLAEDAIIGASSGDSAVLAIDAAGNAHELTSRQVKNPPVGSGGAIFVPFHLRLQAPWRVLVVSDGVWKYVRWDKMIAFALREHGPALIEAFQKEARLPGNGRFQDDFTVVLAESVV